MATRSTGDLYKSYRIAALVLAVLVAIGCVGPWLEDGPFSIAGTATWRGWVAGIAAIASGAAIYRSPVRSNTVSVAVVGGLISVAVLISSLWSLSSDGHHTLDYLAWGLVLALLAGLALAGVTLWLVIDNSYRREVGLPVD